jgi:membrane protein YqaA with SNARE-associated domain
MPADSVESTVMINPVYWALFVSGLLSSTLLPGNSEAVFSVALLNEPEFLYLLASVTLGNTIGGVISWGMGRAIATRYPASPLDKPSQVKALNMIQKWGSPALLLSWVPLIGDPLCLAAGWLKTSFTLSLLFIFIGKLSRYAALAWMVG